MILSRLYANRTEVFPPVDFHGGLNVVLAEIRLPENRDKDTHNLGKSLLGRLIDFGFLAKAKDLVLIRHPSLFSDFVFFLEVILPDGTFLTIRRGISDATKVAFKRHGTAKRLLIRVADAEWDHHDVPFEKARALLDGLLNWRALKPWDYRKEVGYLLRSQDDYREVIQLHKFAYAHADWKPFVAQLLGFDAVPVRDFYKKEKALKEREAQLSVLRQELGDQSGNTGKIDGVLLLKRRDSEQIQQFLASFDFTARDSAETRDLVERIDRSIADLNSQRYSLSHSRKKIQAAIEGEQVLFDPEAATRLFKEAGVLFEGQIKKDFRQLVEFNKAITEERSGYLVEERAEIDVRLREIAGALEDLGRQRVHALTFLTSADSLEKYKRLTSDLTTLKADIGILERQRAALHRITELRAEVRTIIEERNQLQSAIEADLDATATDRQSLFNRIRIFFSEFVEKVLDRKALLSVRVNKAGHLEFSTEILDEEGNPSSADKGHTHRKLLCMAFDMAVLRAHLDVLFPRFAFHDGAFESLDDRKKENLLGVLRHYGELGIQSVITTIDSDLPHMVSAEYVPITEDEVVLRLHDEGDDGRLFKGPSW